MSKYDLIIESRNLYSGPEQRNVSELFEFVGYCDWADDAEIESNFTVQLWSDKVRWKTSIEINANLDYIGTLSVTDKLKIRHNFQLIPRVGFYGSYYRYMINKKIPPDGKFEWGGCTMNAVPRNVDQEFMATLDTITIGYEYADFGWTCDGLPVDWPDFEYDIQYINGIQFVSRSTGATLWHWDFDDGTVSELETPPLHRYVDSGDRNVSLTINGTITKTKTINVAAPV
jgi:hypothetical protein